MRHIRSQLVFLGLTLVICCVAYPLVLLGIGRAAFADKAEGSLAKAADGRIVGSRQIAQPFTADEYFWPRPSAASYNGAAAGGSNWGANNPKLRSRVVEQIAAMIRYRTGSAFAAAGRTPLQDVEAWLAARPNRTAEMTAPNSFDDWLKDPANAAKVADLEPVPADMVTASGAGLDPHITLRNALSVYQSERVAAKRTGAGGDVERIRQGIADLVRKRSFTPLAGLVGDPLVNVLEVNLELDRQFPVPPTAARTP